MRNVRGGQWFCRKMKHLMRKMRLLSGRKQMTIFSFTMGMFLSINIVI